MADGPLSPLEDSKYDFRRTTYPLEGLGSEVPSYIVFYVNLPDAAKYNVTNTQFVPGVLSVSDQNLSLSRGSNQAIRNAIGTAAVNLGYSEAGSQIEMGNQGKIFNAQEQGKALTKNGIGAVEAGAIGALSETIQKRPAHKRIKEAIAIYMPDTVFHTYNHNYDSMSLTDVMGDVGLAQRGFDALGDSAKNIGSTFTGIKSGSNLGFKAGGMEMIGNLAEKTGKVQKGYTDFLLRSQGLAVNPQVELMYKGTTNRSFVFEFKFQPKTQEEARVINNIILTFRKYAAPDMANENGTYFIPPGQFDIDYRFHNQRNPYIGRIASCVLENISINYSSAGQFATFADGMPVEISMQLTFKEADIITRGMITGSSTLEGGF